MLTLRGLLWSYLVINISFKTVEMIYLTAEEVKEVLTWPMVIEAVEEAMVSIVKAPKATHNDPIANQPTRSLTQCGNPSKVMFTMPAFVGNFGLTVKEDSEKKIKEKFNSTGVKVVTSFRGNDQRDPPLPNILANIMLFSSETGQLECVMDATQITAWRTAAASAVATKYLYFKRCSQANNGSIALAIIGCGVQGQSHALAFSNAFKVKTIYLWNRTKSKAFNLKKLLNEQYPQINVIEADTPADAVKEADVICVGTYSPKALIDLSMLPKKAIHINTVGAGEVHFGEVAQDIYDNAVVYVDSMESANSELKGLKADIRGEVGEVIKNVKPYPVSEGITIFQSMGMAVEDITVAQAVLQAFKNK